MISLTFFVYLIFYCNILIIVTSFYSINYYDNNIIDNNYNMKLLTFIQSPNAKHVADIYNRLSGLSPILIEGNIFLMIII